MLELVFCDFSPNSQALHLGQEAAMHVVELEGI